MINYQGKEIEKKINVIKYHNQNYRPLVREFGETKSASLQHGA